MPAIPLDVLVAARQALDLVMSDPGVPGNLKARISFTVGLVAGNCDFITRKIAVDVTTPASQLATPTPDWRILLADLRHVVRWHDQLTPADIERFKATIAKATT